LFTRRASFKRWCERRFLVRRFVMRFFGSGICGSYFTCS
jgi:hypothetical protein